MSELWGDEGRLSIFKSCIKKMYARYNRKCPEGFQLDDMCKLWSKDLIHVPSDKLSHLFDILYDKWEPSSGVSMPRTKDAQGIWAQFTGGKIYNAGGCGQCENGIRTIYELRRTVNDYAYWPVSCACDCMLGEARINREKIFKRELGRFSDLLKKEGYRQLDNPIDGIFFKYNQQGGKIGER